MSRPNEYSISPRTEADEDQLEHVIESVKNVIASLNAVFADRARSGRVMSTDTTFDAVPGTQVLTPRQYGVVKVRVWEQWQTGLLQSLLQGEPLIYERPLFSTDTEAVDSRENADDDPHVKLIYFGDEFDVNDTGDESTLTFKHGTSAFQPEVVVEEYDGDLSTVLGIEFRAYRNGDLTVTLMDDAVDDVEGNNWQDDGSLPGSDDERQEHVDALDACDSPEEAAEEFERAAKFLADSAGGGPVGLPSTLNILLVSEGVRETAEITHDYCPLRQAMARALGVSIYGAKTTAVRSVLYEDDSLLERLQSLDAAAVTCDSPERIDRLAGWMVSHPNDVLDYSIGRDLSSEKSMIDVVNHMERENIDPDAAKYLLLLPHHYNASTAESIQRDIERGREIVRAVEEFDDRHGTDLVETVLHPTWAHRGDVSSVEMFREFLAGNDPLADTDRCLI